MIEEDLAAKLEVEAKLQLDRGSFESLLLRGRVRKTLEQLNVYYDYNWRLAESNSTFRVRAVAGVAPAVTFKRVLHSQGNDRVARELEQPFRLAFPRRSSMQALGRTIDVERDLSPEYRRELLGLNLPLLVRAGWMRNRRHLIELAHLGVVEADVMHLPNGEEFFEVEVETADGQARSRLVEFIIQIAPACSPSSVSKFERFRRSLVAQARA